MHHLITLKFSQQSGVVLSYNFKFICQVDWSSELIAGKFSVVVFRLQIPSQEIAVLEVFVSHCLIARKTVSRLEEQHCCSLCRMNDCVLNGKSLHWISSLTMFLIRMSFSKISFKSYNICRFCITRSLRCITSSDSDLTKSTRFPVSS